MAGRGSCQGSRPLRGAQSAALTQALPPARFSAMWECVGVAFGGASTSKTKTAEVMVEADLGSPFPFRCVSHNRRILLSDLVPSLPVHPSRQVNPVSFFHTV